MLQKHVPCIWTAIVPDVEADRLLEVAIDIIHRKENRMIKFQVPLLAVRDVEVSKKFYKDIFEQEVV